MGGHPALVRVALLAVVGLACGALAQVATGSASAAGTTGAPVVTLNPSSVTVAAGQSASFTAGASGSPTPGILWQVHTSTTNGFQTIAGAYQLTLTLSSVSPSLSGSEYRAYFKNSAGSVYTSTATLTVLPVTAPTVVQQPVSLARPIGAAATFTAGANGTPTPTVQWLWKGPQATAFSPISGATSPSLVILGLKGSMSGTRVEATFSNPGGSATTVAVTLTVSPIGTLVLSPQVTTVAPNVHQQYAAHAYDASGHDLGDVTQSSSYHIGPVGTCAAGACWSGSVGGHTISATMTTASAHATLNVATVSRLVLTPGTVSAAPGTGRTFHAEGFDSANDNLGDLTSTSTFAISPNGSCSGPTCTASSLGAHVVTAKFGTASGTATVNVVSVSSLIVMPVVGAVPPGTNETFRAEGLDGSGNDLGDVTNSTAFSISPDGSCSRTGCQASVLGTHKVTGTDGSATGSARLLITDRFVELLFSRTEVTAADGAACQSDDADVARLDTTVAPYLRQLGLAATGSIETGPTPSTALWCAHSGQTMATSWALAQRLAANGWSFVTHSETYPTAQDWAALSPAQQWDETCGAAQTIDANGLPGASDAYLWPNNVVDNSALTSFVEPCFGTNRIYGDGLTTASEVATAPYRQSVQGISGGPCIAANAPCHNIPGTVTQYNNPEGIISQLKSLPAGSVLTLQVYLLVTGTSPSYTTNATRWDCSSPDLTLHWTNDAERYCWSDLQVVLNYLASSGIGIVQPGALNAAFGRTGYSDHAVTRPAG